MVCKVIFCSEFPDIPDKAGRKTRLRKRRRRAQAIAKRYAFHVNAVTKFGVISKISIEQFAIVNLFFGYL